MLNANLLFIVLISSLLSACGFYVPKNTAPINISITSDTESAFVTELKKHLDANITPSLHVEISTEVQTKQIIAYKNNGDISSYMLTLSVPIKIIRNQTPLLAKNLTATTTLKKMELAQADKIQTKHSFNQLRKSVIVKLLRILTQLNAN